MARNPCRVALMLDLEWPYKRHAGVFAGTQQYAKEQGWTSIIDEFAHDTLPARRRQAILYDGIIARANLPLTQRANRLGVPVVNVWSSSPVRDSLPGVFPEATTRFSGLAQMPPPVDLHHADLYVWSSAPISGRTLLFRYECGA